MRFLYFIGALLCAVQMTFSQESTVKVVPELLDYWVLESGPLKLDCIYKYSGSAEKMGFYKNNKLISLQDSFGFNMTTKDSYDEKTGITTITTTIFKPTTTISDSDKYECRLQSGSNSNTNVHVFTVTSEGAVLIKGAPSVNLKCDVPAIPSSDQPDIIWSRNNTTLVDGTKYKIHDGNNTLEILNPERADIGEYFCRLIFNAQDVALTQEVVPRAVILKAEPKIDSHDKNKNYVQGDQLDLKCMVSGYPVPEVTWKKDGVKFNTSHRIHLFPYGPSPSGKLTIYSLEFEDKGMYSCEAESKGFNITVKAEMKIRVKDKLAALWPFLGIVAEVVVLCIIILVYERRRTKRLSEEDDSTDANVDDTADNTEVRHRRT